MELPQIDNYHALLVNDVPLIDVRAPIEFNQGAFPLASNLPLMNDEERQQVGIRYKEQGQENAIALGHDLVSNEIKSKRVADWVEFTKQNPHGALYCFRGGLRSKISQQWIYEATGVMYPRISGGYKALRRYLINELDKATTVIKPIVLGGRTGTGKTVLLQEIKQQINLEEIYNHRGSAFGQHATPQPSQIDVENRLSIELLKHQHQQHHRLVFEDESCNIGSRELPRNLYNIMCQAPLVLLEIDIEERVNNVFHEYIIQSLEQHQMLAGNEPGFDRWQRMLQTALAKIQRRLGGARFNELNNIMQRAFESQLQSDNPEPHKDWIKVLLQDYYDPMYDYQLSKKTDRILFRGNSKSVREFLEKEYGIV